MRIPKQSAEQLPFLQLPGDSGSSSGENQGEVTSLNQPTQSEGRHRMHLVSLSHLRLALFIWFIWKADLQKEEGREGMREREKKRERQRDLPLQWLQCLEIKPGAAALESRAEPQDLSPAQLLSAFLCHKQGTGSEVQKLGLEPIPCAMLALQDR